MKSVFARADVAGMQSDWVVTDNQTLADAAVTFAALEGGRLPSSPRKFLNWLSFLEAAVLHGCTLADDRLFRKEPRIQTMKAAIGDYIAGLDLGDETRSDIKRDIRSFVSPLKEKLWSELDDLRLDIEIRKQHSPALIFSRAKSDLHRSLFYIALASSVGLPYRPAYLRERVFEAVVQGAEGIIPELPRDLEVELASGLLKRVVESATRYSERVHSLGGPRMVVAELPPIAALVVSEAKQVGTWSEALHNLRDSKAARGFRRWIQEVVGCLRTDDGRGVLLLERANRFMDGWGSNPDEGLKYVTRSIGVGRFHSTLDFALKYQFRDPILKAPAHLLFLSQVFRSSTSLGIRLDPRGIPLI